MPETGGTSPPLRGELKRRLQEMDNEDFEYFVADLWGRQGWETTVSQKSRDKSLDVLVERDNPYHQRHAIQAKRYQAGNRVGGPSISEYASLRDQFNADAAVVVTTSGFTRDARERAETLNVKLIDGDDLVDMVKDFGAYDLVREYTSVEQRSQVASDAEIGSTSNKQKDGWVFGLTSLPGISLERNWGKVAVYSMLAWVVTFLSIGLVDPATSNPVLSAIGTILVFVWLGASIVTLLALYLDMKAIRRSASQWQPQPRRYFLGFLFLWPFVLPYYFYKRRGAFNGE